MMEARAALFTGLLVATPALADEGMWTCDNPPLAQLKAKHGFEPTKACEVNRRPR